MLNNHFSLVCISKDLLTYCSKSQFLKLKLPQELIKNYELSDDTQVKILIKEFIDKNKIIPGNLIIVFDNNFCFNQSFAKTSEFQDQAQNYIDNVPLEDTLFTINSLQNENHVTVISQKIVNIFKEAFQSQKYNIKAAISENSLKIHKISFQKNLEKTEFKKVIQLSPFFQTVIFSISFINPTKSSPSNEAKKEKTKSKKSSLRFLLPAFLLLILILIIQIILPSYKKSQESILIPTVTPTPTVIIIAPEQINFQITYNNTLTQNNLNRFKNELNKQSYTTINLKKENNWQKNYKTYIYFSPLTPQSIKDPILKIINTFFIDVTVQEKNEIDVRTLELKLGQTR